MFKLSLLVSILDPSKILPSWRWLRHALQIMALRCLFQSIASDNMVLAMTSYLCKPQRLEIWLLDPKKIKMKSTFNFTKQKFPKSSTAIPIDTPGSQAKVGVAISKYARYARPTKPSRWDTSKMKGHQHLNCWRFRNWIHFISSSQPYNQFLKQSWELPFLKLTLLHLKMDAWKTIVSFWDGLFLGANLLLVSGRVGSGWLSSCWYGLNDYWSIKLTLTFWQLIHLPRWQLLLLVARVPNVGQCWYIHWFPKMVSQIISEGRFEESFHQSFLRIEHT